MTLVRRFASMALGVALALALLELAACFINTNPPLPHAHPNADLPADASDLADPADASEEPG